MRTAAVRDAGRLVETHGAVVQNETLATELTLGVLPEGAHRSSVVLEGETVEFGIVRRS